MVYKQSGQLNPALEFEKTGNALEEKIMNAIDNHKRKTEKFSSEKQLEKIKYEVKKMMEANSSKEFTPAFPRMIVDSWDFNNQLGIDLLRFFEQYKKIK